MTGWRSVCLFAGIVYLILFSIPVWAGVFHIGNITGLAAGVLLVCYALFAPGVHRLARTSGLWRGILTVFGVLAAAGIILSVIISVRMFRAAHTAPEEEGILLVLGCQVKGIQPSLMLTERLETAEKYLKNHPDVKCILSGGKGNDEMISEAACMAEYLTGHGIDEGRLILEDQSTSTRENLLFSLRLLKENKLGTSPVIVTNEFHEYRAFMIAKKLGMTPSALPAGTHWWLFPAYLVREWYGVIYEWLGL